MIRFLKKFCCKHKKTIPVQSYLEKHGNGRYITRYVWKCKNCGKQIWSK